MTWSFRFARVLGIDLKVHVTFLFILLLGAFQWSQHGIGGAFFGAGLMLALFVCVLLHELGHSVAARAFGIPTKEIVLLPIGGLALLSRMPRQPLQELVIALAGPFVNVVLAGGLLVVTGFTAAAAGLDAQALLRGMMVPSFNTLLVWLLGANVSLVVFNMIPAFPLDGGRVLRAALGFFTDYTRATAIAAGIGQLLAVALGLFGIFSGNLMLALVALFIFVGAGGESAHTKTGSLLARMTAGQAWNRHAIRLSPSDPVEKVADLLITSYQPDFAVVNEGTFEGVMTREELVRALAAGKGQIAVAWVMKRELLHVDEHATLEEVRERLVQAGQRVAAVESNGRFLGLVSLEDIAEAMLVIPFMKPAGTAGDGQPPVPPTATTTPANARWLGR